jgi:hypothetical protein
MCEPKTQEDRMSKYRRIETKFKDEATLRQALADVCQERGITFEAGEGLHLYGYMGDQRSETAELVIRRNFLDRASNDMGFHRLPDGSFEVIRSEFDSRPERVAVHITNRVKQRYARLQVEKVALARGLRVEEIRENDGVIRLRLVGQVRSARAQQVRIR